MTLYDPKTQPWATVQQAAAYFEVNPFTVRAWIKDGKLRGAKIGRSYRIDSASVAELMHKWLGKDA